MSTAAPPAPPRSSLSSFLLQVAVLLGAFVFLLVLGSLSRVGAFVPVGLAVGLAVLLWAAATPRVGLVATVVVSLLVPLTISFRIAGLTLGPGRLIGFAFLVGWIASLSRADGPYRRRTPLDLAVVALVGAYLLSITANSALLSQEEFVSGTQTMLAVAVDFGLFFLAAVSVLGAGWNHLNRVLKIAALTVAVISVLGIVEWVTRRNVYGYVAGVFPGQFGETLGAVTEVGGRQRGGLRRVVATFEGPNRFGAVVVMTLPLLVHYAATARRGRLLFVGGAATSAVAGLLTISRSVFLGAAIGLGIYMLASGRARATKGSAVGVAALLAVVILASPSLRNTVQFYFVDLISGERRTAEGRLSDYRNVLDHFNEVPVAGSGPGTYATRTLARVNVSEQPLNPAEITNLDNTYLAVLAELGGVGLLALISLLWGGIAVVARGLRRAETPEQRSLVAALLAAVIVYAVESAFFDTLVFFGPTRLYFLLLAGGVVAARAVRPVGRPVWRAAPRRSR